MVVRTTATVEWICYLRDEDADEVREYAERENCTLKEAVAELHFGGDIDLYDESYEADFTTDNIDSVEE